MGLGASLGKAVLKRIESSPRVQEQLARSQRTMPVTRAAHRAAYSRLDDEAAKLELGKGLDVEPGILQETLAHLPPHDDYINDRVRRLLEAVATDAGVAGVPAERADLFCQEETIGRMPMRQAFQHLAKLEPGLLELERRAANGTDDACSGQCGLPKEIREPLSRLVGGGIRSDHELLHSTLATSIVHQYLQILAGNTRLGTADIAYFDSPIKHYVSSHTLFYFSRKRRSA